MGNTIASLIKRLEECRPEISSHLTFGLLVKMSRWMRWARSRSSVEAKYGTGLRSRESGSGWLEVGRGKGCSAAGAVCCVPG